MTRIEKHRDLDSPAPSPSLQSIIEDARSLMKKVVALDTQKREQALFQIKRLLNDFPSPRKPETSITIRIKIAYVPILKFAASTDSFTINQAIPKIKHKTKPFGWITEMVELGLLTLVGKKPTGKRGPMQRLFSITPKGLAALEQILKTVNFEDINRYSASVPIVLYI